MSRAVYIGGFGNGVSSAEHVMEAVKLERNHEDVDYFTFAQAMESAERISRAVQDVDVVTHSAGLIALKDTQPRSVEAICPPLPTSIARLVGRTSFKTLRMHTPGIGITRPSDVMSVARYDISSAAEFLARPGGNLRYLGVIAHTHASRQAAAAHLDGGISVRLGWTEGDEYYKPTSDDTMLATLNDVPVAMIPGVHDELVLRPAVTLRKFQEAFDAFSSDNS